MRWQLKQINLLDEPADVLVCSANVSLNLSGGVGAELLGRYGDRMQKCLHAILHQRSPRAAKCGEVFAYSGEEMPYKAVLHAVAIDGWYKSSPQIITDITRKALRTAAEFEARKVAFTVLATGFGNLSLAEFAQGVRPVLNDEFPPIEEVVFGLLLDFQVAELARHFPELATCSV
jgi:O-acetyl-ADP-ribose deacetylase (regulator of RNase III)